jgi:hypothetical protein
MQRQTWEGKKKTERTQAILAQVAENFTLPALNSQKPCKFCHPPPE